MTTGEAAAATSHYSPVSSLRTRLATRMSSLEGGWPSLALLVAPGVLWVILGWVVRWVADDGWINVRILQQVFAGNGYVYNAGERVEAGTSTLWLALLILAHPLTPWWELSELTVALGLLMTALAMTFATLAGVRLARRIGGQLSGFLPLGTVAVAALPPFWDFATSGLETSLTFCWLALCFWLLVRHLPVPGAEPLPAWRPIWPAVVIGLGWLVRPDAALYAAFFALALLVSSKRSMTSWLGAFALAIVIPGSYQIFRMGYFAALVPNTALAKNASANRLPDGLYYLADFVIPYAVWFPLLVGAALLAHQVTGWVQRRDWATTCTVLSPVIPALLHAAYIVRVGGDFMHARFLLPATFALLLPVAVVGARHQRRAATALVALVAGWGVLAASGARVAYTDRMDPMLDDYAGRPQRDGVANEREYWNHSTLMHRSHQMTAWRHSKAVDFGQLTALDAAQRRVYYADDLLMAYLRDSGTPHEVRELEKVLSERAGDPTFTSPTGLFPSADGRQHLVLFNMGIQAVYAGVDVIAVDRLSLTDAITARAKPSEGTLARAGHHATNPAWQAARYADLGPLKNHEVRNAEAAMQCGEIPTVIAATTEPMSRARFVKNLKLAPKLTRFTFPEDPTEARRVLCGSVPPLVER